VAALVLTVSFTNHYVFDWWQRRKRAQKSARSHAQRLVDKHKGTAGAEAEARARLAGEAVSGNERKHMEEVLRAIRTGGLTSKAGEIEISKSKGAADEDGATA